MDKLEILTSLCTGFKENLIIFAITLVASLPLGLLITFGTMSKFKPLKWIMKTYVWIIRGTPLMLQLFVVLYAPGLLWGWSFGTRIGATLVAFILNYSAYFSEIFRGGIESIPKGQYEAGQVLGLTKAQVFIKIVLMQVVKRVVPPMSNEIMTLTKDTSLARIIGVGEIIMSAERFTKQGLIWPLFSTAIFFLAMCGILTLLLGYAEKKMDYYKG
jgi:polar amino acid transport system permease protein